MLRRDERSRSFLLAVCCVLAALVSVPDVGAQERPFGRGRPGRTTQKPGELKKYDEVITREAKSFPGVFLVHRLDDKIFFEVPKEALGRLMLWTIEVAKGPSGVSWGGKALGDRVVRFERRGNKIYLWNVSFEKRANGKAVQRAVDSANMDSIIHGFSIEAEGKDRSAVIDATPLFLSDLADFSVRRAASGAGTIDSSRSYVDEIKAFKTNVEVRSLLTFRASQAGAAGASPLPRRGRTVGGGGGRSYTVLVHSSLVQLPAKPMRGRHFDARVGYFTRSFEDYAGERSWMERRQFIARFRLEKKDPAAAVSEPVKPIVFYLSREVPEKWRPYLKKGVEDWLPAFEKAGFKNAIVCKDAPDEREDPSWDPEDARYSVIRWVADPTQNAMGPHVHDPRSGEVISAHVIFWHDIIKLVQQWYFIQCGGNDPRVTRLPLSDEITGECLRYVACHEIGHTLGLRHNHRASQAYTIAQLRDPRFVAEHGTVASIMSYGRFNYVAQPEDGVRSFLPRVGPYDVFAIEWGYRSIPEAKTAQDERRTLDTWAARQLKETWLRFGGEDGPARVDPSVLTENIGSDVLEATALGLKNLDRVLDKLVQGTTNQGEDYSLLEDTYHALLQHRGTWLNAVAKQVGGVVENRILAGRSGETFTRVPRERQQAAVKFLIDNAFKTPKSLLRPSIVNHIKYSGVADEITSQQKALLAGLLSSRRFHLLLDAEVVAPQKAYSPVQFVNEVQEGVWSEVRQSQPVIDALRRKLQRAYLAHLKSELSRKEEASSGRTFPGRGSSSDSGLDATDFRAVVRAALQELDHLLESAIGHTQDPLSRVHLQDCRHEIKLILEAKE